MGSGNIVYDKAYDFAIQIVKTYQQLGSKKKEYVLSKQLLKCGTSIGANIAEATGGISRADFSNKISIAYKECLETKYWLCLLKDTEFIELQTYKRMYADADEIAGLLFAILKTTRINNKYNQ
jgi:four helix bundle protein